jgi:tryptophanase
VELVRELWDSLKELGVPVTEPAGGHGVFVDGAAMLPHLAAEQHPVEALAGVLFAAGGVRGSANLISPRQEAAGMRLLRLAVPIGQRSANDIEMIVAAFERVLSERDRVCGLERTGGPAGMIGRFAARYRPVEQCPVAAATAYVIGED